MPAIVVVAKVPIEGKSKTRLIPKLGASGSVRLATAMLQDVVETIGSDVRIDVLLVDWHAPLT